MHSKETEGFRRPSAYEISRVSACIEKSNKASIRRNKRLQILFMAVGVAMISSMGMSSSAGDALAAGVIGFVFLGLGLLCIINKKTMNMENKAAAKGDFYVRDGYISKLEANSTTTGCYNASFASCDNSFTDRTYRVRKEQVAEGTEAILVYIYYDLARSPHKYLFTPFMLTDEGIRLHW